MATGDYRQSWERVPEGPKPEGPPLYTPTTEEVRMAYNHWGKYPEFAPDDFDVTGAEFDRWLASVRADAWDEGAVFHGADNPDPYNPYRGEKQ